MNAMLQALESRRDRGLDITVILDGQEYALIPKEEVPAEKAEGMEEIAAEMGQRSPQGAPQDQEKPSDLSELAPTREELAPSEVREAVGPMKKGLRGAAEKFWKKKGK